MPKINVEILIHTIIFFFVGAALFFTVNIFLFKRQLNASDNPAAKPHNADVIIEQPLQAEKGGVPDV